MRFRYNLKPDGKFLTVTFPDIPEALTQGIGEADAALMAKECLALALEFYFDGNRRVPTPTRIKPGDRFVELETSLAVKVLLLNTMIEKEVRPAELARRLGTSRQNANRLVDLRHPTKIDAVANALKVLGKRLEVKVA